MLISPAMIQDHMPDTVLAALEKVRRKSFSSNFYAPYPYTMLLDIKMCAYMSQFYYTCVSHNIANRWCINCIYFICALYFVSFYNIIIFQHYISWLVSYSYCSFNFVLRHFFLFIALHNPTLTSNILPHLSIFLSSSRLHCPFLFFAELVVVFPV